MILTGFSGGRWSLISLEKQTPLHPLHCWGFKFKFVVALKLYNKLGTLSPSPYLLFVLPQKVSVPNLKIGNIPNSQLFKKEHYIIHNVFLGIVRLTNFSSLRSKNLSLTKKSQG
jgi:hypothetical protein